MELELTSQLAALLQVFIIDISLAGDNAIVIGLAAAGLPPAQRRRAIWIGLAAATVLRIVLAAFAVQLLQITGLMLAGGLLLLWVTWKMYREIRGMRHAKEASGSKPPPKKLSDAIMQMAVADISMSLDNVLAVAGAARDHYAIMAIGLVLSIALMALAATTIAKLLNKWHWLAYVGLVTVGYVACHMIWDGAMEVGTL